MCTTDNCDVIVGCKHANNSQACDDGNACSKNDACVNGVCAGAAKVVCDDGNVCTNDTCNVVNGCTFTNDAVACDDLNGCTSSDTCSSGSCKGAVGCDVNECTAGLFSCPANEGCENTIGSYNCVCNAGFGDCNGDAADGCETSLNVNASNCNV